MVLDRLPLAYSADFVTGLSLTAILLALGGGLQAPLWYGLLVLLTLIRWQNANQIKRGSYSTQQKHLFLIVAAFIGGTVWGMSWLVIPNDPSFLEVAVVGMWIAGMIAGAVATFSVMKVVFFAFAAPASLLFFIFLLVINTENRALYVAAYSMYLCFMIPLSLRISTDLNLGISMHISNERLRMKLRDYSLRLREREDELSIREKFSRTQATGKRSMENAEGDSSILDSVSEGIYGINKGGAISFINSSALELLGYKEEDVVGKDSYEYINRYENSLNFEDESTSNLAIIGAFRDGDQLQNIDSVFYCKDGSGIPVRFACKPVKKGERVIGTVVSFSDLRKQREMEAMLVQAQKMEAIGRLTEGIAHDFNNLLTVILGNLHLLTKRLVADERSTTLLGKVMNAAKSGAALSNRLLSFSREQALVREAVDVVEMIHEMSEFIDRVVGEQITLEIRHQDENCIAITDRNRLESGIFNLCINARDAMPKGGHLIITISRSDIQGSTSILPRKLNRKAFIALSLADNGTGIPSDIQQHIFEPFFTTKDIHKGTGLGLSSVYAFVKQAGGDILVESHEGKGSTFTMLMPEAEQGVTPRKAPQRTFDQAPKREGTILVVEDDESVREVTHQILSEAGFSVILATDGPDGLAKYDECGEKIDLVFSDVVMPGGINGVELSQLILKQSPSLPIVLVTGHTEKSLRECMAESDNVLFIAKPYDANDLPILVSGLLERSAAKHLPAGLR